MRAKTSCNNMSEHSEFEIESIIDKFVPLKKHRKRSRKKHLSKEAIRKIVFKQTMWNEDYANYKEALNAAMTEIRQSKRSYEQKLACNIKNYSCYAYMHKRPYGGLPC